MRIYYDFFNEDFLFLTIYQSEDGKLVGIEYGDGSRDSGFLRKDNPFKKIKTKALKNLTLIKKKLPSFKQQFSEYLKKQRTDFEFAFHMEGTDFQMKVWSYLLALPYAQVVSYSEIARAIGHPQAQRAVGSAVGANPLSIFIPCHRVLNKPNNPNKSNNKPKKINQNSGVVGYRVGKYNGGEAIKRQLLQLEGVPIID